MVILLLILIILLIIIIIIISIIAIIIIITTIVITTIVVIVIIIIGFFRRCRLWGGSPRNNRETPCIYQFLPNYSPKFGFALPIFLTNLRQWVFYILIYFLVIPSPFRVRLIYCWLTSQPMATLDLQPKFCINVL